MFSDAFSEAQSRDINGEFPSDSSTTEVYDYLSDSDLEDECSRSEAEYAGSTEGSNPEIPIPQAQDPGPQTPTTTPLGQPLTDTSEVQDNNGLVLVSLGPFTVSG